MGVSVARVARVMKVIINPEFERLIPPLSDEEFAQLEANILRDGCRDPLVVWRGMLLDGHNRHRICAKHGIEYQTVDVELADRDAAEDWIDANQLGRRNLDPMQRKLLLGRRYQRVKKAEGRPGKLDQNDQVRGSTADALAKQHGVSAPTVKRAGQFAAAVETLKSVDPEIERKVVSGPSAPTHKAVVEAARIVRTEPEKAKSLLAVHHSSETPEHYTPADVIARTIECMGAIDLDPCSNAKGADANVTATDHFTKDDDGLSRDWNGRVYMNPPYGREIEAWVSKLVDEHKAGRVTEAIALLPGRIDTQWIRLLRDYPRCEVEGRLTFIGNNDPAPFPSVVYYLGNERIKFFDAFSEIGDIWMRMDREMFSE